MNSDDSPQQVTMAGTRHKTDVPLKGQAASIRHRGGGFDYNCALHPNMKGSIEVKK